MNKMSAAEFKAIREKIGYSNEALAKHWNFKHRTIVVHWSNGTRPIPPKRAEQLLAMLDEFNERVEQLRANEEETVIVPKADAGSGRRPAAWYRATALEAKKKLVYG